MLFMKYQPYTGLLLFGDDVILIEPEPAGAETAIEDDGLLVVTLLMPMGQVNRTHNQAQLMLEVQQFNEPRANLRIVSLLPDKK
ncbi:hypothetical protein TrVFT333_010770 [Trichoderma virens FT-333]|nr:hypothetical protein TrVFT333_010770 [Trichoderma virens FT-333]